MGSMLKWTMQIVYDGSYSGGDAYEHFPTSTKGVAILSVAEALALMIQFGSLMLVLVGIMLTSSKNDKK